MRAEWQASERIDYLLTHDLRIIQSRDVFSFSMDAVLLARFCSVPARGNIVDLCTGNGVVPLLLSTRTNASIAGVELQERLADMAVRSVEMNGLQERIRIVNQDLKAYAAEMAAAGKFVELVTVNPPYLPVVPGSDINENEHVALARHEIACTLQDVVQACARLVRTGGKVAMVHRANRLAEIIETMRAHRLEPKRLRLVHPRKEEEANMALIEAVRDGKPEMRILPPLIVYEQGNAYCAELLNIYYGEQAELSDGGRA